MWHSDDAEDALTRPLGDTSAVGRMRRCIESHPVDIRSPLRAGGIRAEHPQGRPQCLSAPLLSLRAIEHRIRIPPATLGGRAWAAFSRKKSRQPGRKPDDPAHTCGLRAASSVSAIFLWGCLPSSAPIIGDAQAQGWMAKRVKVMATKVQEARRRHDRGKCAFDAREQIALHTVILQAQLQLHQPYPLGCALHASKRFEVHSAACDPG